MTENDSSPPYAPASPLRQLMLVFEGWLGAFWVTLLCIGVFSYLIFIATELRFPKKWEIALLGFAGLLWLCLDVPLLWRVWSAVRNQRVPLALHAAARQPIMPMIMRPAIAMWWLAHFGLGLVGAYFTENVHETSPRDDKILEAAIGLLLTLCYGYAANIYLIQAVVTLTRGRFVQYVWNWRGLFDVGLVGLGLLLLLLKHR